jgi:RES domain-containing protein
LIRVWRLVTGRRVNVAFTDEGAWRYGGRWNKKGIRIVYMAESRALALLEMLVRDEPLRARYVLIPAEIPSGLTVETIDSKDLSASWREPKGLDTLKEIGSKWVTDRKSVVLIIPSAIVPEERNYLLNPLHSDFTKIRVGKRSAFVVDSRIIEKRQVRSD